MNIKDVIKNEELHEVARRAVEDALIERRNTRTGILNRNNGLVCKERDGRDSNIIRMSIEEALVIGLRAIEAQAPAPAPAQTTFTQDEVEELIRIAVKAALGVSKALEADEVRCPHTLANGGDGCVRCDGEPR